MEREVVARGIWCWFVGAGVLEPLFPALTLILGLIHVRLQAPRCSQSCSFPLPSTTITQFP